MNKIPAKLPVESLVITVDNREQHPWNLDPLKMEPGTLQTGDYQLRDFPPNFAAVERKSLDDAAGCIGIERDRFSREIERLLGFQHRLLVIESSWDEIEAGNYRSRVSPNSFTASLLGWQARGLPVLLTGDRERAQRFTAKWFYLVARTQYRAMRALMTERISATDGSTKTDGPRVEK
jgi:DNA excision repair protein ERCC-4